MSAMAASGHSTIDHWPDCFTIKSGYSTVGSNKLAAKDRFRAVRTGTPDPYA
jgi:hypothetical protein